MLVLTDGRPVRVGFLCVSRVFDGVEWVLFSSDSVFWDTWGCLVVAGRLVLSGRGGSLDSA